MVRFDVELIEIQWPIKIGGRTALTDPMPAYAITFGTAARIIAGVKEPDDDRQQR